MGRNLIAMHYLKEPLSHIPQDLVSVNDYQRYASSFIAPDIFAYIYGGGADEITLRRNRQALDRQFILPRVLQDVTQGTTATTLLGDALRYPLMLAPVAFQRLVHPEGELATAEAASVLDTGMVVSTLCSQPIEKIAEKLTGPKWFQLYIQQDRDFTLQLVKQAEAAGYTHVMVTIDAPLQGIRNRAQRAGYMLPEGVEAVLLKDRPALPRRILEADQSIVLQGMMSEAPVWETLHWLQARTRLPLILKGILSPQDAALAKQAGMQGIVVSNHGGRTLDCVPSAIEMLPWIRKTVGDDYPILVDGGIERGTDLFKALALGANAAMLGRPQLYALAVAGALGVAHMLRVIREEFEVTMAMAGVASVEAITSDLLISEAVLDKGVAAV